MSSTEFVFFGSIGKNKMVAPASDWQRHWPWPIRQKGSILYSGAWYVALCASCFFICWSHFNELTSTSVRLLDKTKGRDLNQSYDKIPYTLRKIQKAAWQHNNATKIFDTQTLRTDLGRSVATQLLRSKPVYGIPTHQLCTKAFIYEMNFTLCVLLFYNDNGSVQTL